MTATEPGTQNPVAGLDAYELRHLGDHLAASRDAAGLERLLALDWGVPARTQPPDEPARRPWWRRWGRAAELAPKPAAVDRRNAWYEAKNAAGDVEAYFADVEAAWRMASEACARAAQDGVPVPLGRDLRCALMDASVRESGRQLGIDVICALVAQGVWTERNALARVGGSTSGLVALLPVLGAEARSDVLNRLLARLDPDSDQPTFAEIAPWMSESQIDAALGAWSGDKDLLVASLMPSAFALRLIAIGRSDRALALVADGIRTHDDAARVLAAAARELDAAQARAALALVEAWDDDSREAAWAALYPRLAQLGDVDEAFAAVRGLSSPYARCDMAARLAPALDAAGCREARALLPDDPPAFDRHANAVLALARRAAAQGDAAWARSAIDDLVAAIAGGAVNSFDFLRVAPELTRERPQETLRIAVSETDEPSRLVALATVAPQLPAELWDRARQAATAVDGDYELLQRAGGEPLAALAMFDPDRAIQIVRRWGQGSGDGELAIGHLAPKLDAPHLSELAEIAGRIRDEARSAATEIALDGELAVAGDATALERLAAAGDAREVSVALADAGPRLPEAFLGRAAEVLDGLSAIWHQDAARALAPRLGESRSRALMDHAARGSGEAFALRVSAFAPYLSPALVDHAITLAARVNDRSRCREALAALAAVADGAQLARVRAAVPRRRKREWVPAELERAVAVRLAALGRAPEALAAVSQIDGSHELVAAIRGIANEPGAAVDGARLEQLALTVRSRGLRAEALGALSCRAREPERTRLREAAVADAEKALVHNFDGEPGDGSPPQPEPAAMARLARIVGGDVRDRALAAAAAAGGDAVQALEAIGPLGGAHLDEAVRIARALEDPRRRDAAFGAILRATHAPSEALVVEALEAFTADGTYIHYDQFDRLRAAAYALVRFGPVAAHRALSARLSVVAHGSRSQLAAYIAAITPAIGAIGGEPALREARAVLRDVGHWWP